MRVLVLYLSIGSGHQAAAQAVAAALAPRASVTCTDPIGARHPRLLGALNLGNSLTACVAARYQRAWAGPPSPIVAALAARGLLRAITETIHAIRPDRIVATHALPARLAAQTGGAPVTGVLTDYGAHGYWLHPQIDRYCVPHADVALDLMRRGVAASQITVTGLPISRPVVAARSVSPPHVLMVIGGRRRGPYRRAAGCVIGALENLHRLDRPIGVTIVTGANTRAYRKVLGFKSITPLGLIDDLPGRLAGADIVAGKPGGVFTAEVLAAGAAFIALTPGPGQETANANFLQRHAAALRADSPAELLAALQQLMADPARCAALQARARELARPDAADAVAQLILDEHD
jgi:processive 1,2-diacylglycerol beta-glucosyltransferase